VPVQGHWRIEAPHNRFSRNTFRLKLGRKAARGLGLGGSAATIYSHSQERRDLFLLDHATDLRGARAAFNSVERPSLRTGELPESFRFFFLYKISVFDSEHTLLSRLPAVAIQATKPPMSAIKSVYTNAFLLCGDFNSKKLPLPSLPRGAVRPPFCGG
jgi:hypothetical protein